MPTFVFKFAPSVKKRKSNETSPYLKYTILTKDVEGVVFIDINGKYTVITESDGEYPIVIECYSCKGVKTIYGQQLQINDIGHMNRLQVDRSERDRVECGKEYYLPFVAGCCVKGNIVHNKHNNKKMFKIKKVYVDNTIELARNAIRFYRDNYDVILANRLNRLNNGGL